ncbi:MAG: hypothetical protein AB8G05_07710 [Oligoflexales bacterium]
MLEVNAIAPTRVDLVGGTLDIWPINHVLDAKGTINLGVSLFARTYIRERAQKTFLIKSFDQGFELELSYQELCANRSLPLVTMLLSAFWRQDLPALEIQLQADSPKGAGLGGSSSLAISIASALVKARHMLNDEPFMNEYQLVQTVQNLEAKLLQMPAGCQDHWGAVRGGLNYLHFPFEGVFVETFPLSEFEGLDDELILCFCGKSRFSGMNNWELFKQFGDGDTKVRKIFSEIGGLAAEAYQSILKRDWQGLLQYSRQDWELRKILCPGIETEETKHLDQVALEHGAYFSRVCGAGGGGVMAVFSPKEKREGIVHALNAKGGTVLEGSICDKGVRVEGQI